MSLGTLTWATMNVICWKSLIRCCREDNQKRKLFALPPRASRGNPSLNTCSQTFTIKCFNISSIWNNLNVIWICDFNKSVIRDQYWILYLELIKQIVDVNVKLIICCENIFTKKKKKKQLQNKWIISF